jgi:hypothetical protein
MSLPARLAPISAPRSTNIGTASNANFDISLMKVRATKLSANTPSNATRNPTATAVRPKAMGRPENSTRVVTTRISPPI